VVTGAPADTEDVAAWHRHARGKELAFIARFPGRAEDNPQRAGPGEEGYDPEIYDPTSFDLFFDGRVADYKGPETPFYRAEKLYGMVPHQTVVLNVASVEHYRRRYPGIDLIFDVNYPEGEGYGVWTPGNRGVWRMKNSTEHDFSSAPVHVYGRRVNDPNNKKDSYLLDLLILERVA